MKKIFIFLGLLLLSGCIDSQPGDGVEVCQLNDFENCKELESDLSIIVFDINYKTPLQSPVTIAGKARGHWFFEGSLGLNLIAPDGSLIANGFATANGEWATEELVDFEGTLDFNTKHSSGILQVLSDNPSGLYENQLEFSFPVGFVEGMVREYVHNNLEEINPITPVVGGSWYVVEIVFSEDDSIVVTTEDGHIQSKFSARYFIDEKDMVVLEDIVSLQ